MLNKLVFFTEVKYLSEELERGPEEEGDLLRKRQELRPLQAATVAAAVTWSRASDSWAQLRAEREVEGRQLDERRRWEELERRQLEQREEMSRQQAAREEAAQARFAIEATERAEEFESISKFLHKHIHRPYVTHNIFLL